VRFAPFPKFVVSVAHFELLVKIFLYLMITFLSHGSYELILQIHDIVFVDQFLPQIHSALQTFFEEIEGF
jgi:hypothetical protein